MRKYGLITTEERQLIEWSCSICHRNFMIDELEAQEVFSFSQMGGYSSVFGDGAEIYVDICQHCFKDKFSKYCTVI